MWLINDDGFFSTVQDYKDSDWVYVRGRSETDIEAFVVVARRACGGRISRRGWSGCVSVFVDEAVPEGVRRGDARNCMPRTCMLCWVV